MMKLVICLAFFALTVSARQVDGPCQTVTVREGLDIPRYLGLWFELERYESPFQVDFECVTANYNTNPDGSVRVTNEGLTPAGQFFEQIGRAVPSFPDAEPFLAKLNVSFFDMPNDRSNYWVLSTDYINYAMVFSCEDLPSGNSLESYWFLSRSLEFPTLPSIVDRVEDIKDRYIDRESIRPTDQSFATCTGLNNKRLFPLVAPQSTK